MREEIYIVQVAALWRCSVGVIGGVGTWRIVLIVEPFWVSPDCLEHFQTTGRRGDSRHRLL